MPRRDILIPVAVLVIWTAGIAFACTTLVQVQRRTVDALLLGEAQALFQHILTAQLWNAGHGGVYAVLPGSNATAGEAAGPGPLAGRIVLPDGRVLEHIDPVRMTQQLASLTATRQEGIRYRVLGSPMLQTTSEMDAWEEEGFRQFAAGAKEVWVNQGQTGEGHLFRFMAPLVADARCTGCHGIPPCEAGEVCGAVSLVMTTPQEENVTESAIARTQGSFLLVWAVGGLGLVGGLWLLVCSRRAALEAVRAKSDFLAAMNHELRTPLNGILGLTDLALAGELSDQQRDCLLASRQSAERLHRLFTFMLEYARLDVQERRLGGGEPFALGDCLRVLEHDFKGPAQAKGLDFQFQLAPGVPAILAGDMNLLVVALSQLLDNAVKFTTAGTVRLEVQLRPCPFPWLQRMVSGEGALSCLRFIVSDTGPGISKDLAEKLFEPFIQGDSSYARQHAGVGLGLALARRLARTMGGDVAILRTSAQGTVVELTARFSQPEEGAVE